jgi:predicted AlkP superfamily phosphohydrolase/phosphomutase
MNRIDRLIASLTTLQSRKFVTAQYIANNQLPMYAKRAVTIINENNKKLFVKTLTSRLNDIEKENKRKRIEKVIKKVS